LEEAFLALTGDNDDRADDAMEGAR
jgi:hypothetical protein